MLEVFFFFFGGGRLRFKGAELVLQKPVFQHRISVSACCYELLAPGIFATLKKTKTEKKARMRVKSCLFMPPIILKYLPFCSSRLPFLSSSSSGVIKGCWLPVLTPSRAVPSPPATHAATLTPRPPTQILLPPCFFLLFLPLFFPAGSSLFRVVPLGTVWAFDQVSVTLFNILFP